MSKRMVLFLAAILTTTFAVTPGPTVVFSERFDNNSAGWLVGPEWEIGPARASSGQAQGNPDPAQDHGATGSNGIAGVMIGGNAGLVSHGDPYWMTSPVIPVTGAGRVTLHFERWLNSDQSPYMTNRVEVFDGKAWVGVWESPSRTSIADAEWTHQSFDVTPYQNANMRVRFGFARQPGAFAASSWNVDDVRVEATYPPAKSGTGDWAGANSALGIGLLAAALALLPVRSTR